MKKATTLLLVAIVAVALVLAMIGCESYKQKALSATDTTAKVESNGGSIVKQGEYLYFINGYSGYLSKRGANKFGAVKTGAIMRVKAADLLAEGEDVDLMANAEIVVPKAVIASSSNVGFSIYGGYIYYVTHSADEDRSGSVKVDNLQFMRTDLQGQHTQVILEIEDGVKTEYKYTPNGLVYVRDDDLYFKSTAEKRFDKKKDGTLIAEDVTVSMPKSESYDPQKGMTDADVVFYTKTTDKAYKNTQTLYAYMAGSDPIEVINEQSYADNFKNDASLTYKYQFSFSLLGFAVEDNGTVTMAYTKTYYTGTSSSDSVSAGTYLYNFADSKFAFDPSREKMISTSALSSVTVIGYEEGVLTSASPVTLYSYDFTADKANYSIEFKDDNGSIASPTILGVKDNWMYYVLSNKLYCYNIDNQSSHVHAIGSDSVYTDFIAPELVDANGTTYLVYFRDEGRALYAYELDGSYQYNDLEPILLGVVEEE